MGEFPSGQRGQTVNLLLSASMVRIHPLPPRCVDKIDANLKTPVTMRFLGFFCAKNRV